MVYSTLDYQVSALCPSSDVPKKHNVSESGSISVISIAGVSRFTSAPVFVGGYFWFGLMLLLSCPLSVLVLCLYVHTYPQYLLLIFLLGYLQLTKNLVSGVYIILRFLS
jgi:thiosulfate reductase cytochrome b subunit